MDNCWKTGTSSQGFQSRNGTMEQSVRPWHRADKLIPLSLGPRWLHEYVIKRVGSSPRPI